MRKVKERDVTRYILHKQHLLEGSQAGQVLHVVDDILALHATSATTPYLSLFARMKGFQRSDLDQELYVNRNLIRLEVMRGTLFITSKGLAPMLFQATRLPESQIAVWIQRWGIAQSEYRTITENLLAMLQGGGKTLPAIKTALPQGMVRTIERRVGKTVQRLTNVNIVLTAMMRRGLVFSEKYVEPILTRQANRYVLIREGYPQLNLTALDSAEAKTLLINRYIETFGPVTETDITWWTGFTKTETQEALTTIEQELRQIRIKGLSDTYFMLEADYTNFTRFKSPRKTSFLLLPYEDPYTKGYKIRDRLIDADHEVRAYVGSSVQPTILINGKIVGIWNRAFEEKQAPITLQLFQRIKRGDKKPITRHAKALGKMMLNREITINIE